MSGTVADFYDGKAVLVTGGGGFIGSVLLELLLRCCPGLRAIYVILREKKGITPEERKKVIFKKLVFNRLREEAPSAFDKVHVLEGDTSQPDFGLNETNLQKVTSNVSIIFHIAAIIHFSKTLRYTLMQNLMSVKYAIDLCRKLQKLDAVVYTSTAYGNVNKDLDKFEEIIYKLPISSLRFIEELETGSEEGLQHLRDQCGPPWPNPYTFSKCVSESLLLEEASDLPVSIVRPSITSSTWKYPEPGYIEEDSGAVLVSIGVMKGFIRVYRGDPDIAMDIIPVDVVCNAHVLAAMKVATQRFDSPLVINCACRTEYRTTLYKFMTNGIEEMKFFPMPNSYQLPSLVIRKSAFWYWFDSVLDHYAPALIIDAALRVMGKKTKLFRLYKKFDKAIDELKFFTLREYDQADENLISLMDGLSEKDKEAFFVDVSTYRVCEEMRNLPSMMPVYQNTDRMSAEERRKMLRL